MFNPRKSPEQVAKENDHFRKNLIYDQRNRIVLSRGVAHDLNAKKVLELACSFDGFTKDNDPWGEHDLGVFEFEGKDYMFKIDYFQDTEFKVGGDPYSEPVCRAMIIMLASEY